MPSYTVIAAAPTGSAAAAGDETRDAVTLGPREYRFYSAMTTPPSLFTGTAWRAVLAFLSETDPPEASPITDTPLNTYTETSGGQSRRVSIYPHSLEIMQQVPGYVGAPTSSQIRTLLSSEARNWVNASTAFTLSRQTMLTVESPTMYGARVTPNAPWNTTRWLRDKNVVWTISGGTFPISPATPFGGIYSEARQVGFQMIALLRTAATYTVTATVTWEDSGTYYYCQLTDTVTTTAPTYNRTLRMVQSSPGADEYTDLTTLLEALEGLNRSTNPRVKIELESGQVYTHTLSRQRPSSEADLRLCLVFGGERTDFVTYGGADVAEIVHPSNWIEGSDTDFATPLTSPLQFRDAGTVSFTNIRFNGGYDSTAPTMDGANTAAIKETNTTEDVQFIFDTCRFRGLNRPLQEGSTQAQILGAGLKMYSGYFNCLAAMWSDFGIHNNSAVLFAVIGCAIAQTPGTALVGGRFITGTRYLVPYAVHGPVRTQTDAFTVISHNQLISLNGWFCYDGTGSGNDNTLLTLVGYETYTPTAEQLKNVAFQPCLRALQGTDDSITTANLVVAYNEMTGGDAVAYFGIQENDTGITPNNNVQVIGTRFVAPGGSDRFIDIGVPVEFLSCEFVYLDEDPVHNLRKPTDHVFGTTKTITEDNAGNSLPDGLTGAIGLTGCTVNARRSSNNGSEVIKSDTLDRIPNLTPAQVNNLIKWGADSRTGYADVGGSLIPATGGDGTVDGGTVADLLGALRPSPPSLGAREPI